MQVKIRSPLLGSIFMAVLFAGTIGTAGASTLVPQTAVPGACIPQFTVPLPVFGPTGIARVDAVQHPNLTVKMKEVDQNVLTGLTDTCNLGLTFAPTRVWAYEIRDTKTDALLGPANWPAVTVDARRFTPTTVTYKNELPAFNPANSSGPPYVDGLVQGLVTVDQTVDWTDPFGAAKAAGCTNFPQNPANVFGPPAPPLAFDPCLMPYGGLPPAVAHLHGAEALSHVDGGPLAWFTSNANGVANVSGQTGRDYFTEDPSAGVGTAVYTYQNTQEPGTPWFHDHAMGQTRTNVYSGMAAFYFLRDPKAEPKNLPSGPYEIEMAIQDRQLDTTGQLYFPDGSDPLCGSMLPGDPCLNGPPPNPLNHPFWIPEFIGDVAIVNGAPWPKLNVEPRRYRFRLLDGSNARFYNLRFGTAPVYMIGADDNYLDNPVRVNSVFIAPGERADVIIDFRGLAGKEVIVTNSAAVPYPSGLVPGVDQPQMASIMKFIVSSAPVNDTSCNPGGNPSQCRRPTPMVHLADGKGHVAAGVKIDKVRQLTLKEFEGAGGPLMVFVNNTQFMGTMSPSISDLFPSDGVSELPQVGSTELWEIINLTMDAHPMHTHLMQFQILDRQPFDVNGYVTEWNAAFGTPGMPALFPGCVAGQFCPGYGPPLSYNVANADGAIGGNPAVHPYFQGTPSTPAPEESGWKDTAKAYPGQVMRIVVRVAPTSVSKTSPGVNTYPFDPTSGPGYVWHCHIIDHEDQDMMRPFKVTK